MAPRRTHCVVVIVMIASENDTMQLTDEGQKARDELNTCLFGMVARQRLRVEATSLTSFVVACLPRARRLRSCLRQPSSFYT